MVATRRSGATKEHKAVSLRAATTQRQQERQASARQRRDATATSVRASTGVPSVYHEMLIEAGVPGPAGRRGVGSIAAQSDASGERPLKRIKRPGYKSDASSLNTPLQAAETVSREKDEDDEDNDEDEDIEFEDIVIPAPRVQTRELDSEDDDDDDRDEEDDEDDDVNLDEDGRQFVFEDVSNNSTPSKSSCGPLIATVEEAGTLELNLTEHENKLTTPSRRGRGAKDPARAKSRKPLSRAERERRVEIHKMHLLCLMAHAARRNRWCNSPKVHAALRPLLTEKMLTYLNPGGHLSQFGQSESLKTGLQQAATMFKTQYRITQRGLRRALWAESPEQLTDYELPNDMESVMDKNDFIAAAECLQGSRDVGAQLFCALLRAAGVETRLVCSLQPLSFLSTGPALPKSKPRGDQQPSFKKKHPIPSIYQSPPSAASCHSGDSESKTDFSSPRRRLGHPDAAAYHLPTSAASPKSKQRSSKVEAAPSTSLSKTHVVRGESAFPVYWVEVLDAAHQKWQPVDPLVTCSQWRPAKLEPPAADKNNQLSYVIGFAAEGDAKDVTRRYAKAYNAKTKRTRIDGIAEPAPTIALATAAATASAGATTLSPTTTNMKGSKWLARALHFYQESGETDVDQIEDIELNAIESREPMPRNVAEFQNHPIYALSRHLRRHEVLVPNATAVGTVSAGAKAPLERIYRRRDVRMAYSADRWYRLGRVVLPNEIPAKWLPKPVSRKNNLLDDDDTGDRFTEEDEQDLFGDGAGTIGRPHPSPLGIPLFIPEQTEVYRAPPVRNGRIPKNKFGNIDLYVPSMVPEGGEHIIDDGAARAAFLLGVDYAPALSGFDFKGKKGTAVMRGAVVAKEYAESVRAVLEGLKDLAAEAEAELRTRAALRAWTVFLRGLRIRQRVRDAARDRGESVDSDEEDVEKKDNKETGQASNDEVENNTDSEDGEQNEDGEAAKSDVTEEFDMVMDDEGDGAFASGGGFLDEDDYGGGGFIPE